MKGIVITTNNALFTEDFDQPLYKSIGATVGEYIEHVKPEKLPHPYCMICNEEGALEELDLNPIASILYGIEWNGCPILGDVVIMKDGYYNGEPDIVGLDDDDIKKVKNIILKVLSK